MRLSLEWLADALDPAGRHDHRRGRGRVGAHRVRGRGRAHRAADRPGDLVVGRVLSIEELTGLKKPIRFCTVDVGPGNGPDGSDEPRGIICGATNFVVGDTVVVALPGTVLPGGFAIASRTTYGRISDGMICSDPGTGHRHGARRHPGDRPGSRAPGTDARPLIGADDAVIELAITPDRGYALSIRGLARELAAAFDLPFTDPGRARRAGAAGRRLAGDDRRPGRLRPVRHRPGARASTRPRPARSGCGAGCPRPASGRSRWPSTSPTT